MKHIDYWLKRNRRRITFGRFLSRATDSLAAFLFVFGAMVLGVRMILPAWWPTIGWFALLEIPMLLAAFWYAMIVRPKPYEAAAVLDERLGTGGLLMSIHETDNVEWMAMIDKSPRQWADALAPLPWLKFGKAIVVPALFALTACTIPGRVNSAPPVLRNSVARNATGELQNLLEKLSSSKLTDSSRTAQMMELVQQLVAESETQPLTNEKWAVIDSVRDAMRMELDSSANSAGNALSLLQSLQTQLGASGFDPSQLEKIANGDFSSGMPTAEVTQLLSNLDPQQTSQLMTTLSSLTKMLTQNETANGSLPPEVREMLQEVMSDGELQLPGDIMSQLSLLNKMGGFLQQENDLLSDVRNQLMSGDASWSQLGGALVSQLVNSKPDDSATGTNPITEALQSVFGNESDEQQNQFDEVTVTAPERQRNEPIVSPQIPDAGPEVATKRNTARDFSNSEGDERWSRRFRPRHRQVVERYFAGQN